MDAEVDVTAIKFNQTMMVILIVLAFLMDWTWLILVTGVVYAIGTIWPRANLFGLAYRRAIRPLGLLRPRLIWDDPAPHRFAQGMAASFLLLASLVLLVLPVPALGWGLAGLVAVLAAINVVFSFCTGCFIFYQLTRLGLINRKESMS